MSETTPAAAPVPPGWYDDGTGSGQQRWWSGVEWTEHVASPVMIARPLLPADRPVYSVWIWLIVLLPLLSTGSFFLWQPNFDYLSDPGILDHPARLQAEQFASMFTPGYFTILFGGWILYGLSAVFAWRDAVWLRAQGVVRPFAWPWVFLSSAVYVIGRSVIVRRVAAPRGLAPIWVLIGVVVLGFAVGTIWTISLMSGVLSHIPDFSSYSSS
jgi:uncharacterized protein DUF2510